MYDMQLLLQVPYQGLFSAYFRIIVIRNRYFLLFSPRLRTTIFAKRLHKQKVKRTFVVLILLEGVRF